jgi:hypothetical protein
MRNRYGTGFIKCFYDYHRNLSPLRVDLVTGQVLEIRGDLPTHVSDGLLHKGFNTTEQDAAVAEKHAGRQPPRLGD